MIEALTIGFIGWVAHRVFEGRKQNAQGDRFLELHRKPRMDPFERIEYARLEQQFGYLTGHSMPNDRDYRRPKVAR